MVAPFNDIVLLVVCFFLGSISAGYYLVRLIKRTDIRLHGNTGARQVATVLGPAGFFATALLDLLKGMLAVWIGRRYGHAEWVVPAVAFLVVLGHVFPPQLGFRGGRGVMTGTGAIMLLDPLLMVTFLLLLIPVLVVLRRLTLGGMIVVAFGPFIALLLGREGSFLLMLTAICLLVLFAHRDLLREELGLVRRA